MHQTGIGRGSNILRILIVSLTLPPEDPLAGWGRGADKVWVEVGITSNINILSKRSPLLWAREVGVTLT